MLDLLSIFKLRTTAYLLLGILSIWVSVSPTVAAITSGDIQSIIEQHPYYDAGADCAVGSTNITPGNGAPTGLTFPNLDPQAMAGAIDKFVSGRDHLPEFEGLGATIVASAKHSNVNPFLIIGHAVEESGLGTDPKSVISNAPFFNTFGRSASDRQVKAGVGGKVNTEDTKQWFKWSSIKTSVDYTDPYNAKDPAGTGDQASYLRGVYGDSLDTNNLTAYITKYAPPDENDTARYIADMQKSVSEMASLASGGATTATASTTPAAVTGALCGVCTTTSSTSSNTIVLDPGHAGAATEEVDPVSGVEAVESQNTQTGERQNMWKTAQIMKSKLEKDGYRVVLTKSVEDDPAGLIEKAHRANATNAALAISLHSTPGTFGTGAGLGDAGVTPQEVGRFRQNWDNGKKKTFEDTQLAQKSLEYAKIIQAERAKVGDKVDLTPLDQSFTTDRVKAHGDISIVQLFGTIPWVYNEVGQTGFDAQKYADGITNGIEKAVPITGNSTSPTTITTTDCPSGAVAGNIVQTALNYAWPEPPGDARPPRDPHVPTDAYAKAVTADGAANGGEDCGIFVAVVMHTSGADKDYPASGTSVQEDYVRTSGKYDVIDRVNDPTELQPGDILIVNLGSGADGNGHTYIFVGKQSGGYNEASASQDERMPSLGRALTHDNRGDYLVARLKQ